MSNGKGKIKGKILFADTAKPDSRFQKYKVTLLVNEEQYAIAEAAGLKVSRGSYDGQEQLKVEVKNPGFGTRKKDNTQFKHDPIPVLLRTPEGNVPYTEQVQGPEGLVTVQKEIPRNSKVVVSWEDKPYSTFGGGIAKRMRSILVVEEGATSGNAAGDFDEDEDFDDDDF